jgi:hypothetical protein
VDTFASEHTLAGDEAESYFQAVDRAGEEALGKVDSEASYALTSAAIEIRARAFYPAYQEILEATGSRISVSSILADEAAHLSEMRDRLQADLPDWQQRLERVLQVEARAFEALLDSFESAVARAS